MKLNFKQQRPELRLGVSSKKSLSGGGSSSVPANAVTSNSLVVTSGGATVTSG